MDKPAETLHSNIRRELRRIWIGQTLTVALGRIWAGVTEGGLASVFFSGEEDDYLNCLKKYGEWRCTPDEARVAPVLKQIGEYLAGSRRQFELQIDWSGMGDFQTRALRMTWEIPYGETRTYGQLAADLGSPGAARAVGRAEATNPMPLIIPCHRVVGSDGSLHGYGGGEGIPTKRWLLALEQGSSQPALF